MWFVIGKARWLVPKLKLMLKQGLLVSSRGGASKYGTKEPSGITDLFQHIIPEQGSALTLYLSSTNVQNQSSCYSDCHHDCNDHVLGKSCG